MSDVATQASAAQRLLDDPMLKSAFANVRDAAILAWTQTKSDGQREREIAWLTVKVIDRVQAELQAVVDNGKIAAARIQAPLR